MDVDAARCVVGADPELGGEVLGFRGLGDVGHEASGDHTARNAIDLSHLIAAFELEEGWEEYRLLGSEGKLERRVALLIGTGLMTELIEQELDFRSGDRPDLVAVAADSDGFSEQRCLQTDASRILDLRRDGRSLDDLRESAGNLADRGMEGEGAVGGLLAPEKNTRQRGDHLGKDVVTVLGWRSSERGGGGD